MKKRFALARFVVAPAVTVAAGFLLATGAAAQSDVPQVISPLRVETDLNNVNLVSGKTTIEPPSLSVPGAPNLRYDRVQNAAPYASGRVTDPGDGIPIVNWSVHTGSGSSESFVCSEWNDCSSVTGTGSTFRGSAGANASGVYRQAGSGAVWTFNQVAGSSGFHRQAYAVNVVYPNGEGISYAYDSAVVGIGQTVYRARQISSNLGYHITITYQSSDPNNIGWGSPSEAAIYNSADPSTPLGRLTYNANGTITDLGGRIYACTGCSNGLGADLEVADGTMQLPGDAGPSTQVTRLASGQPLVGTVVRDGVSYSYAYSYNGGAPFYQLDTNSYLYTQLTVTGPSGFNQVYNLSQIGGVKQRRNVINSMTDSLSRVSNFQFDDAYRPTRVTYPEGNAVRILYDDRGNIVERRAYARSGTGLADLVEIAAYPDAPGGTPNLCTVMCWRPTSTLDARLHQTDYSYNDDVHGQLTEQVDPADANGVRRRTSIVYTVSAGGISRRTAVRVCNDAGPDTTCGTGAPIQTEYDYWQNTLLPSAERRIDVAQSVTLTTAYTYDAAGRLLSTDGPMPGSDDTSYNRYDIYGRLAGTISPDPDGAAALPRLAVRNTYDQADRLIRVETGTLASLQSETVLPANWTGFAPTRTAQTVYDGNGRKIREFVREGASGPVRTMTEFSYDALGRPTCTAVRMNPAAYVFSGDPPNACVLNAQGDDGPDRITRNVYDAAGQRVQLLEGVGTADEGNEAAWGYNLNGQVTAVTDGNGNRAELRYDGHMRQDRWTFPSAIAGAGSVNPLDYEQYGYDAAGNRVSLRKRDGSVITYTYDNLNRVISKIVPERSGLDPSFTRDVYYGYDLRNLQLYARFDGAAGPGVTNAYDGFGRLTATTSTMDGTSRTLSYAYDANGNRTRITHPVQAGPGAAFFFTYGYDGLNRLEPIYEGAASLIGVWHYNDAGLPGALGRAGSGVYRSYDGVQRLSSLVNDDAYGLVTWSYGYNPAGQIASMARDNDAFAWTGHYAFARTYATNGLNQYRTTASTTAAGPSDGTQGYDPNGNLISSSSTFAGTTTTTAYAYDVENRLVSASNGAALAYDPLGRLYQVTGAGGGVTRFLYDGDALVAEYDAAGNVLRRYVHGAGADVPLFAYEGADLTQPRQLFADHQGSITGIADGNGILVTLNAYDEYGIPALSNQGRFQYTGQIWLPEIGMYHYKARIYSPTLGRFLQTDPIGYDDQFNLYDYVGDDPINRVDPGGTTDIPLVNSAVDEEKMIYAGIHFDMPGVTTVMSHGNPNVMGRHILSGPGSDHYRHYSAAVMARGIQMQSANANTQSQPIALLACRVGGHYAEDVAARLGRPVMATTSYVWTNHSADGTVSMVAAEKNAQGRQGAPGEFRLYGGGSWADYGINVPAGARVRGFTFNDRTNRFTATIERAPIESRIRRIDR